MKHVEVVELVVQALPGASQGECLKECLGIAVHRWQNVQLRHNGRSYDIHPNELLAAIYERPQIS